MMTNKQAYTLSYMMQYALRVVKHTRRSDQLILGSITNNADHRLLYAYRESFRLLTDCSRWRTDNNIGRILEDLASYKDTETLYDVWRSAVYKDNDALSGYSRGQVDGMLGHPYNPEAI